MNSWDESENHGSPDPVSTDAGSGSADVREPLFSEQEYAHRLHRVREKMAHQGLSALIVTDPANLFYLTGYDAWSFYVPQMLFVPAEGDILLFLREMDARGAFRTSWLPEHQIIGYPERYVQRPHLHPFDWVAFTLRRRGQIAPSPHGCVGLEMDAHFFSPKGYRALVNAIPEWSLVDCFELVNWVRSVKSDAEIHYMHVASRVTTAAMTAAIDAIEPGVPQNRVAARIAAAQAEGDGDAWGDFPAIVPMLPTGASADTPPPHVVRPRPAQRRRRGGRVERCASEISRPPGAHRDPRSPERCDGALGGGGRRRSACRPGRDRRGCTHP